MLFFFFFFLINSFPDLFEWRSNGDPVFSVLCKTFLCTRVIYFQGRSELKCRENCARVGTMAGFVLIEITISRVHSMANDIFIPCFSLPFPLSASKKFFAPPRQFVISYILADIRPRSIKFRIAISRTSEINQRNEARPCYTYEGSEISPSAPTTIEQTNYPPTNFLQVKVATHLSPFPIHTKESLNSMKAVSRINTHPFESNPNSPLRGDTPFL